MPAEIIKHYIFTIVRKKISGHGIYAKISPQFDITRLITSLKVTYQKKILSIHNILDLSVSFMLRKNQ